jgi:hypothetical protein
MAEDSSADRSGWGGDDQVGKPFIVLSTNGDLPTNPMSLRECMVCGGVFTRDESRDHSDARCQPSPEQPFASAGRYRHIAQRKVSKRSQSASNSQ